MDLLENEMDILLESGREITGVYVGGDEKDIVHYETQDEICNETSTSKVKTKDKCHEMRKELKLLKMSNMKMKKQLRLSMRVRFLNGIRLENEVVQLNKLLFRLKSAVIDKNNVPNEDFDDEKFSNPEKAKYQSRLPNSVDNSLIRSSIYTLPVKKEKGAYRFFCESCDFRCVKRTPFEIHLRRHANNRPFSCEFCQRRFVTSNDLKMHSARHANQQEFSCDQCHYTTYRADMLVNHKEKHTGLKTHECDICGFKTDERSRMVNHRKSHSALVVNDTKPCLACDSSKKSTKEKTMNNLQEEAAPGVENVDGKTRLVSDDTVSESMLGRPRISGLRHTCCKPWTCHFCGKSFKKRESLTKHLRTHTGERPHSCDQCDYSAATRHTLLVHQRTHSGDKPYRCSHCEFRCTTKGYLKIHLNKHQGIKPYSCNECDYRSVDSCKLSAHKKVKHSDEKPFSCDRCPFATKLAARLRQHKKRHEARLLVCRHCGQGFRLRATLLEHEGTHTGDQPFKCTQCCVEKRFTLETSYKRHLARHKLRFECQHCPYKTGTRKDLLRHSKLHDGGGGKCAICGKRCLNKDMMVRHMQIRHPNYSLNLSSPTNPNINIGNPVNEDDSTDVISAKNMVNTTVSTSHDNSAIPTDSITLISNNADSACSTSDSTIPTTVFNTSIPIIQSNTSNTPTTVNLINNNLLTPHRIFTNPTNPTISTSSNNVTNLTNSTNTNLLQLLLSTNPVQPSYQLQPTILNIPQSIPQRVHQFSDNSDVDNVSNPQEVPSNPQMMMTFTNPTQATFYWGQGQ